MGHDISAYTTTDRDSSVAYLRRSMSNPKNVEIYTALDALSYHAGVSGIGDERQFSTNELKKALRYLSEQDGVVQEIMFIANCLDNVDDFGNIVIFFG